MEEKKVEGNKKKVAIVFWDTWISAAPTIINIAEYLGENGFYVDIFTRQDSVNYGNDPIINNCNIINVTTLRRRSKSYLWVTNKLKSIQILNRISLWIALLEVKYFIKQIKKRLKGTYEFVIGVDILGLYSAGKIFKFETKTLYLSLEIVNRNTDIIVDYFKDYEARFQKKSVFTFIQDDYRAESLFRSNGVDKKKYLYFRLPNSPRGEAVSLRRFYFNEKFNIPRIEFIVLSAGMIDDAVSSIEVAKQVYRNGERYKMVFHEREKRPIDSYLLKIQELGGANLFLSLNPVPYSEVNQIYQSADVGIAFYNPAYGENFTLLASASGKMTHCLKYGLPVVVLDLPGFAEIIEKYQCGIVIKDLAEMNQAIDTIRMNYPFYKENVKVCYENEFAFDSFFKKALFAIDYVHLPVLDLE